MKYKVFEKSINKIDGKEVSMAILDGETVIIADKELGFDGVNSDEPGKIIAKLSYKNADVLRSLFPFTAPIPVLRKERSFGVGDRLGIAAQGHIKVFEKYDAYPVLAQQSIRELNLTNRTYEDVLNAATFAVYRDGFKKGFGADGDHLKTPEDIEYALSLGFTMITLDCSEHIKDITDTNFSNISLPKEFADKYLGKSFDIGNDIKIEFNETELLKILAIYGEAINFAVEMFDKFLKGGKYNADFEISIDETETPTTPTQHFFVANELQDRGVIFATVAPRFCGEFQKGIDYIGDLTQFESEMKVHAEIARHFGYKLSIHSGSDKFSTFPIIARETKGIFHVKTAGTNWLEAMRTVAIIDPSLYRAVHKYALEAFSEATVYYHVTTDLNKIPDIDTISDVDLPKLFNNNDARQLIHITYGLILNKKESDGSFSFKEKLYKLWADNEKTYADALLNHIGRHLDLLSVAKQ